MKFRKYSRFCKGRGWYSLPGAQAKLYSFSLYLREEGRVQVRYFKQYFSAVSTIHAWLGLEFRAGDPLLSRLVRAWTLEDGSQASRPDSVQDFPASFIFQWLQLALATSDLALLRNHLCVVLDTLFFSRADSSYSTQVGDVWVDQSAVFFRERRFKNKGLTAPTFRVRRFDARGIPQLLGVISKFLEVRTRVWGTHTAAPDEGLFWQLPGEPRPSAVWVARWFTTVAHSFDATLTHHAVRRTGASSCFSLLVPLEVIRDWGGWAAASMAVFRYLNRVRPPSPLDFRLFGWMILPVERLKEELGTVFPPLGSPHQF